jgi:hypothetical protein
MLQAKKGLQGVASSKEHIQLVKKPFKYALYYFLLRRDEKIRTSDLQHPMLARYRATLHPEAGNKYIKCTANAK